MSKNTVKKGSFWSVLIVIVLVAAAVVLALVGSNKSATMKDVNTLTVSMNRYVYTNKLDVVEDECEKAFGDIKVAYEMKGDMSGDNCEIVYVVDADVDLSSVKEFYLIDGYSTPARCQESLGTCWAFSTIALMESSLISQGVATKDNIDLSVRHLAYFTGNTGYDALGRLFAIGYLKGILDATERG